MKKLATILLVAISALVSAQTHRITTVDLYTGDPTGVACIVPNKVVQSNTTGLFYSCVGGVYTGGTAFNGGTVLNPIVLPADPTLNLQAATKQYVDAHTASLPANAGVVSANAAGQAVQSLSTVPSALITYGDSITNGTGCGTGLGACYPTRLADLLGVGAPTNRSVSGAQACDVAQQQMFPNDAPSPAGVQPLTTLMIGTNDVAIKGTGAYEATFNTCDKAVISWRAVPSNFKVMGSTVVGGATGTCSSDTTFTANTGVKCTANASTYTFSITTYGGPIYVWQRYIDGDTGTWNYRVDSGSTVNGTTALTPAIATQNGATAGVGLIRIPVSAGAHTVKFTQTASGTMATVAVGTPANTSLSGMPPLVVMQIPNQLDGTGQTAVNAYRADVLANFTTLQGDGLNLFWAPVDKTLQAKTATGDMFNSLHPNGTVGHVEILSAILSALRLSQADYSIPVATNLNLTTNVTGSSNHTIVCSGTSAESVIFGNTGATETLPTASTCPSGYQVEIYNYDSTINLNISGNQNNVPATISPKNGIIIVNSGGGGGQWWMVASSSGSAAGAVATSYTPTVQVKGTNYTAACTDGVIFVSSGATITLPGSGTCATAPSLQIVNYDASLASPISGGTHNVPTSLPAGAEMVVSNSNGGTNWFLISYSPAWITTPIAGSGAAIPTGPTSSTNGDAVCFTGTVGQMADCGGPPGGGGATLIQWTSPGVKTSNGAAFIANQTRIFDFVLPGSLTATKIDYSVTTADNTATTYDLGIYSNTGTLICHLGATAGTTFAASTGVKSATFLSSCALTGGTRYLLAMTTTTATASLASTGNILLAQSGAVPSAGNTTTGGALNSSITPAADAPGDTNGFPEIRLHN